MRVHCLRTDKVAKMMHQKSIGYFFFVPHPPAAPAADAMASICSLVRDTSLPLVESSRLNSEAVAGLGCLACSAIFDFDSFSISPADLFDPDIVGEMSNE
eukprot:263688_1